MTLENVENVSLEPITKDNWKRAIVLEVKENQKSFVATNIHSIAESSFYETAFNYGIFYNEDMIGFVLIFNPPEEPELGHIVRFMIDEKFQRKGLGKHSIQQIIKLFSKNFNKTVVTLSVIPENHGARAFYESAGFINTGEVVEGELKYKYKI